MVTQIKVTYSVKVPYSDNNFRQIGRFHTKEDAIKQLDFCIKGSYVVKESFEIIQTKG